METPVKERLRPSPRQMLIEAVVAYSREVMQTNGVTDHEAMPAELSKAREELERAMEKTMDHAQALQNEAHFLAVSVSRGRRIIDNTWPASEVEASEPDRETISIGPSRRERQEYR